MAETLLSVRNLSVRYRQKQDTLHAVDDVSFDLERGKVLALVGESGSGKSTAGMSVLRMLSPNAEVVSGEVIYQGRDLLQLDETELQTIRGRHVAMIFQDPVAGLNPVLTIGDQVDEILRHHLGLKKKEAREVSLDILYRVGMPDPKRVAKSYPFQLSGGMCQRVMIGIATALDPEVLIADEPTSALDVTVQAQILYQLDELRQQRGTTILLITHDFGVVSQVADDVAVLYGGRIVERGTVDEVLRSPLHPYSHALLATLPRMDGPIAPLQAIPGNPPELEAPAEHCPFGPRCRKIINNCRQLPAPDLEPVEGSPEHTVACYNPIWRPPEE